MSQSRALAGSFKMWVSMRRWSWENSKSFFSPSQLGFALLAMMVVVGGFATLIHFLKQPVLAASVENTTVASVQEGMPAPLVATRDLAESEAHHEDLEAPWTPLLSELVVRLEFPVSWQLSRTRSSGTVTESFHESWLWEVRPDGTAFLKSGRARVAVLPAGEFNRREPVLPELVYISESNLARLLGIPRPVAANATGLELGFIALHLTHGQRGVADVTLALGEDDRCEVRIEVGDLPTFF